MDKGAIAFRDNLVVQDQFSDSEHAETHGIAQNYYQPRVSNYSEFLIDDNEILPKVGRPEDVNGCDLPWGLESLQGVQLRF